MEMSNNMTCFKTTQELDKLNIFNFSCLPRRQTPLERGRDERERVLYPHCEVGDVCPAVEGFSGLLLGHLGDEVLGVVGRLGLHGCPDGTSEHAALAGGVLTGVVDHAQPNVITRFLPGQHSREAY